MHHRLVAAQGAEPSHTIRGPEPPDRCRQPGSGPLPRRSVDRDPPPRRWTWPPLVVAVTAGQAGDSPMPALLSAYLSVARPGPGRPRPRPDAVIGDKAYSSRQPGAAARPSSRQSSRSPVIRSGIVFVAARRRWPTFCLRCGRLQGTQRRRALLQRPQAVAGTGCPLQRTRDQRPRRRRTPFSPVWLRRRHVLVDARDLVQPSLQVVGRQLDLLVAPRRGAPSAGRRRRTRAAPWSRRWHPRSARDATRRTPPTCASRGRRSPPRRRAGPRPVAVEDVLAGIDERAGVADGGRVDGVGGHAANLPSSGRVGRARSPAACRSRRGPRRWPARSGCSARRCWTSARTADGCR